MRRSRVGGRKRDCPPLCHLAQPLQVLRDRERSDSKWLGRAVLPRVLEGCLKWSWAATPQEPSPPLLSYRPSDRA